MAGFSAAVDKLTQRGLPVYSAGVENKPWGYLSDCDVAYPRGTIVVSARGTIGAAKLPDHDSFVSTQTTIAIEPRPGVDPRFLTRFLATLDFAAITSTTAIPMLTIGKFEPTQVPLPPLPEQRRIVAKLDRLSARSRAARDHLARTAKLAARAKQAILAAAFDAALAGGECSIPDLLSEPIRNGLSIRGNDHPPGVAALRLSAFRGGTVNLDDVRFLQITADRAAPYRLRAGDVLVSRGNGNLRLLAIASIVPETDGSIIFPDTAFRIRISPSAGGSKMVRAHVVRPPSALSSRGPREDYRRHLEGIAG